MGAPGSGRSGVAALDAIGRSKGRAGIAGLLLVVLVAACGTGSPAREPRSDKTPPANPATSTGPHVTAPRSGTVPAGPSSTTGSGPPVEVAGETTGPTTDPTTGAATGTPTGAAARPGLTSLSVPRSAGCAGRPFETLTIAWAFTDASSVSIAVDAGAAEGPFPGAGSTTTRFECDGRSHSYGFRASGPGGSTVATATVHPA